MADGARVFIETHTPKESLIIVFDALLIAGLAHLSITLLTAVSSTSLRRSKAWYLFISAWILYSISFLLLLGQQSGNQPPRGLCLLQSGLIYALPVFAGWTTLGLVADLYLSISNLASRKPRLNWLILFMTYFVPVILSSAVLVATLTIGAKHEESIKRDVSGMFCILSDVSGRTIACAVALPSAAICLVLQVMTFISLRRNRRARNALMASRSTSRTSPNTSVSVMSQSTSSPDVDVSVPMIVRVMLFTGIPIGCIIFALRGLKPDIAVLNRESPNVSAMENFSIPAASLGAALIFGTQPDLLRVWFRCCLRRTRQPVSIPNQTESMQRLDVHLVETRRHPRRPAPVPQMISKPRDVMLASNGRGWV